MLKFRTHQVLQQGRQLLGEGGELDEGRSQVGVVPTDEVTAKFVQSLGIVLFILHMICVVNRAERKVNQRTSLPCPELWLKISISICVDDWKWFAAFASPDGGILEVLWLEGSHRKK